MSLAFLQKKSFHTAKITNQETVWIAERKKAVEDAKTAELLKQHKIEREQADIERITGKPSSGNGGQGDGALSWMYTDGVKSGEDKVKEAEEFLLGKEYVPEDGSNKSDVAVMEEGRNANTGGGGTNEKVGGLLMNRKSMSVKSEEFARSYEDPMMVIIKRQQEARDKVRNNPVVMQRIQMQADEVKVKVKRVKEEKEAKEKKEKKHKRSKSKSKKRDRDSSSSESSTDGSDSDSDSKHKRKHKHHKHHKRSSSSSSRRSDDRDHKRHESAQSSIAPVEVEAAFKKIEGYGLKPNPSSTSSSSSSSSSSANASIKSPTNFGPDPSLLLKREQEKADLLDQQRQIHSKGNRSNRHELTSDEKVKAVLDMQNNAVQLEDRRTQIREHTTSNNEVEEERKGPKGEFLTKMMSEGNGSIDMAERIKRNKSNNQRGGDDHFL